MSSEDPSIDLAKVLRFDYLRKDAIHELEQASLTAEYWSKLEDRERELRQHVKNAMNGLQELLKILGPETQPSIAIT
mgnify:CR=1 FL=1